MRTTSISALILAVLAILVASTKLKRRRKKIATNYSKFPIDVPISLFLQLDVVGTANVWECTDLAFPLVVSQR